MDKKDSSNYTSLANHFLVALPTLDDPNFFRAVVYIYEHNEEGAMGLIVNKPLEMEVQDVLQHLHIQTKILEVSKQAVMMGGPIGQEHGFVLYEEEGEIFLSSSKETLITIAKGEGPQHYLITLGYSGWQSGQVEQELQRNDWLIVPCEDPNLLFETPVEDRWRVIAKIIGVDIDRISGQTGHA